MRSYWFSRRWLIVAAFMPAAVKAVPRTAAVQILLKLFIAASSF